MTAHTYQDTSFLQSGDVRYLSQLYLRFLKDPHSVDPSVAKYFTDLGDRAADLFAAQQGPSWTPTFKIDLPNTLGEESAPPKAEKSTKSEKPAMQVVPSFDLRVQQAAFALVDAYRRFGHFAADLDPLKLTPPTGHPELDPAFYGVSQEDLAKEVTIPSFGGDTPLSLRDLVTRLKKIYCSTVGYDYAHLTNTQMRMWLQQRIEQGVSPLAKEDHLKVLEGLIQADLFERFLHVKFPGAKRFGLEGGDSMVPLLMTALEHASLNNVKEVVIGMAHRGRLNVLTNVMGKPYGTVFAEFKYGVAHYPELQASGDVKYHMGASTDRSFGKASLHLTLLPNPSHLEAVNPVVMGKVRSRQDEIGKEQVLGILIHGDAAFSGQGVISETLAMSQLEGYKIGGVYHIIINNQVGFTTNPVCSRSTTYSSDQVRGLDVPVFHVNGDDPDAVVRAGLLAAEFRRVFKADVLIDLVCYRRHGHNEGDEPAFTQPKMYKEIAEHAAPRVMYGESLVKAGILTEEEVEAIRKLFDKVLNDAFESIETFKKHEPDWLHGRWSTIQVADDPEEPITGIKEEKLLKYGDILHRIPEGFALNPKIARQVEQRRQIFSAKEGLDWAAGEALAFASLVEEGYPVRLSGQDCERGTFSHRHAIWTDQKTEARYSPFAHIATEQARFEVINSLLSEASVLGYEYGYAYNNPHALVMWEAQFGDFSNGAQVYIDQFISSSETKWLRKNGLVMLLPHGFEGQGPEHSSARLERYLQLCALGNMRVVNCTTPASFFHALRRQIHSQTRKPLIVMTPKSLLRLKTAVSALVDFGPNTRFLPVLKDARGFKAKEVKRIVLCSGKVYYDLLTAREQKPSNVLLVRLEQLYPFPHAALVELLAAYPQASVVWCQEEPQNMGAWTFVASRLQAVLSAAKFKNPVIKYVGRSEASSPAVGSDKVHAVEQQRLVDDALTL